MHLIELLERYHISVWWSPSFKRWFAHAEHCLTTSDEDYTQTVLLAAGLAAAREIINEPQN